MKVRWTIWMPFAAACVACSSPANQPSALGASGGPPIVDTLVSDECTGKVWVNRPPPEDPQYLYFVGKSARHAAERDARNEANADATKQFVNYSGVDVGVVDQFLSQGSAKASGVMDATQSENLSTEMRAQAFVSRIKPREYCNQRYQRKQGGEVVGEAFLTNVLVAVPQDELAKVKALAEERKRSGAAALVAQRNSLWAQAQSYYTAALEDERRARIVGALQGIASADKALQDASKVGALPDGATPPITPATLRTAERRLIDGVHLEAVNPRQEIEPGTTPAPLQASVTYDGPSGRQPVANFPVFFLSGGTLFPPVRTDARGIAELPTQAVGRDTTLQFMARINRGDLDNRVSAEAESALGGLQATFLVNVRVMSMEEKIRDLVRGLEEHVPQAGRTSVVIENFTFGEGKTGGPFALMLSDTLRTAIANSSHWELKAAVSRGGLTRGFNVVQADSPAALAQASGSRTVIYGSYADQGDSVRVRAFLKDQQNTVLGSGTVIIPKKELPTGVVLAADTSRVDDVASALASAGSAQNAFRLDLWLDRGDGATYKDRETFVLSVRAAVACYLKLVYFAADGKRTVIFPNQFAPSGRLQAGEVRTIPGPGEGFTFTVEPPFGAETLVAFASTTPFPRDDGDDAGAGMVQLRGSTREIVGHYRGVTVSGTAGAPSQRAEKQATLTTVPR